MGIGEFTQIIKSVGPTLGNALKSGQFFRPQCVLTEPDSDILCEYDVKIPMSEVFFVTANIYRSKKSCKKRRKSTSRNVRAPLQ